MDIKQFKSIQENIIKITRLYETLRIERGDQYNIFKVIHMTSNETSVHSAFISDLLNPQGLHGKGSMFLKLFIDCLPLEAKKNIASFDADSAVVKIEYYIGEKTKTHGGRLDIVVFSKGQAIIIENKIYAKDQENQMIRYHNFAEENYKNKYSLLYLSLDGQVHDEDVTACSKDCNLVINKDFFTISYENTIWEWLYLCREKAADSPLLREGISHYINLIKLLTNKDQTKMTEVKDIANLFMSNNEVIKNFKTIEKAVTQTKTELHRQFWHSLVKKITENNQLKGYPISLFVQDGTTNQGDLLNALDKYVDTYINLKSKRAKYFKEFGIALDIHRFGDWHVLFAIAVNENIFVQISVEKNGDRLLNNDFNNKLFIQNLVRWSQRNDNYRLCSCYPKCYREEGRKLCMMNMNEYVFSLLANMDSTIDVLVADISEEIDIIKNCVNDPSLD